MSWVEREPQVVDVLSQAMNLKSELTDNRLLKILIQPNRHLHLHELPGPLPAKVTLGGVSGWINLGFSPAETAHWWTGPGGPSGLYFVLWSKYYVLCCFVSK